VYKQVNQPKSAEISFLRHCEEHSDEEIWVRGWAGSRNDGEVSSL